MPDSDIQRLVERIEGASEGSRDLDAAIQRTLGNGSTEHWFADVNGKWVSDNHAPPYSTSLDAAMTLVPKGALDHAEIYSPDHQTLGWWFHLMPNANFLGRTFTGFGATLALAITAAALRTRITERTDDE